MSERHEAYLYHVTFNAMHNLVVEDPRKMHAHTFSVGIYGPPPISMVITKQVV